MDLKAKPGCCQEASPMSGSFYIPCNRPASHTMQHSNGETYLMCDMCADHNTRRGFKEVKSQTIKEKTVKQSTLEYVPDETQKKPEQPANTDSATGTSLAVIEIKKETALTVFTTENGLSPYLTELETRARAAIDGYDITTIAGQDGIRSVAYSLSKSKKPLENLAADLKKDSDALIDKVNGERNRGIKFIDDLQKELRRPLTEYEEKEKVRIGDHKTSLDMLSALTVFEGEPTAELVQGRIKSLAANFKDLNWQEFTESAKAATEKVTATLADLLAKIVKAEADAAELARLRKEQAAREKKEREDKIAADAAEAARKEAERLAAITARNLAEVAEKAAAEAKKVIDDQIAAAKTLADKVAADKKKAEDDKAALAKVLADALAKAEQDKKDDAKALADAKYAADLAAAAALKKAESDKAAALQKLKDDAAAAQKVKDDAAIKQAAADKLRADNVAHQKKINGEAVKALIGVLAGLHGQNADHTAECQAIVTAIIKGEIPHVKITY